jgi:hypothetical protein
VKGTPYLWIILTPADIRSVLVFLVVDMLQGCLGQLVSACTRRKFLSAYQLDQEARKPHPALGLQVNAIAPVAGFPDGGHESTAHQGAQAQHKAVVEVLPAGIEGADRAG